MISKLRVLVVVLLAVLATATEVDGNWAEWRPWRPCSVTCGGGSQDRTRVCANSRSAFGGANCEGKDRESRQCNRNPCPVDGMWTNWWSSGCSKTCGRGFQTWRRRCTLPLHGGKYCVGRDRAEGPCNLRPCPGKRQSENTRGAIGGSIGAVVFCVIVAIVCWKKRTGGGHN